MDQPTNQPSLDELYHMIAYIYSDKNAERPVSVTFSHLVEVCGMLTMHAKEKNRDEFSMDDALCKALAWYFPLLAKFKIKSVQDLIFRKYPNVCPYCRFEIHVESKCKQAKGTIKTVNHSELNKIYNQNKNKMPSSLNEWQAMFSRIYPRSIKDFNWSTVSLFEEIGELAEAIRVFETHPKYFVGEAADVFSYIMGIATEYSLKLQTQNKSEFNFESELLKRYPGLCTYCGYQVCVCPIIPAITVGRMAKEVDIKANDDLFNLNIFETEKSAIEICAKVLENTGGFVEIAKRFPIDRGDTNRAMILLCMQIAENIRPHKPEVAKKILDAAIKIGSNSKRPGSKTFDASIDQVIKLLKNIWSEISLSIFVDDNSITGVMGRQLRKNSFKIGIVTALPKEFAAMRLMFDDSIEYPIPGDPNDYVIGNIPMKNGSGMHSVVLTLLKEMGNNIAAATATNLLRSFPCIEDVLMVGIAGGIPDYESGEKHIRLGDIVISNKEGVIQYDNFQQGISSIKIRGASSKPSSRLLGVVNILESERLIKKRPWENYILRGEELEGGKRPSESSDFLYKWDGEISTLVEHPHDPNRRSGFPKVNYGRIGAANILLKNPIYRDQLRKEHNIIAIEMESSGIADSTWIAGQSYILIRGICDYCDPKKNDIWQSYAAVVAASYARVLIESMPVNEAPLDSK